MTMLKTVLLAATAGMALTAVTATAGITARAPDVPLTAEWQALLDQAAEGVMWCTATGCTPATGPDPLMANVHRSTCGATVILTAINLIDRIDTELSRADYWVDPSGTANARLHWHDSTTVRLVQLEGPSGRWCTVAEYWP